MTAREKRVAAVGRALHYHESKGTLHIVSPSTGRYAYRVRITGVDDPMLLTLDAAEALAVGLARGIEVGSRSNA